MVSDIYTRLGTLVAFHDGNLIYDLQGRAVGRLRGSRIYCTAGHYVGRLQDGILLGKKCSHASSGTYCIGTGGQHKTGGKTRLSPSRVLLPT